MRIQYGKRGCLQHASRTGNISEAPTGEFRILIKRNDIAVKVYLSRCLKLYVDICFFIGRFETCYVWNSYFGVPGTLVSLEDLLRYKKVLGSNESVFGRRIRQSANRTTLEWNWLPHSCQAHDGCKATCPSGMLPDLFLFPSSSLFPYSLLKT
jgi:hypothetical protein